MEAMKKTLYKILGAITAVFALLEVASKVIIPLIGK